MEYKEKAMEAKELITSENMHAWDRRILVTGAAGFLGSRIVRAYEKSCQVFAPSHQEMDICHLDSVRAYVEKVRPGIAVHCAAVSDTLRCQEHPEESFRINVEGTEHMARVCKDLGTKLIFCSSDQIYFGSRGMEPHKENEKVCPAGEYGRQKLEAEKRCVRFCPDSVSLRLCWMYDSERLLEKEHGNFLTAFLQALDEEREMVYPIYDYRGITDVRLVVENLWKAFELPGGVYNFGSENDYNTYETVYRLLEKLGYSTERLKKNETAFAENPRNIRVHMGKAKAFGIEFPKTLERLVECVNGMQRYKTERGGSLCRA